MEVQLMTVTPSLSVLLCVTCSIAISMTSQELLQPYVAVIITACMVSYSYAWAVRDQNQAYELSYSQLLSVEFSKLHTLIVTHYKSYQLQNIQHYKETRIAIAISYTIKAAGAKIMTSPISVIVFKAKESIILNPLLLTTIINNVYRYPCQKMLHLDRQSPKDVSSWQHGNCL